MIFYQAKMQSFIKTEKTTDGQVTRQIEGGFSA